MNEDDTAAVYQRAYDSKEFHELRRRLASFVLPISAAFLLWYVLYVLLATYAHDFMSHKLFGNINVALVLGLGQFVTTFAITWAYVRFANRTIDPMATDLRQSIEADLKGDGGDVALGKGEPK
ncbi:DUF485 domain-containing protein [Tsukamurella pseudospumae]|uniref:Clumping factor B n=1 Tax=Tsukamurella pseudospumae TaxID=239498 RepID=A0A138A8U7_9ACTN|nr:DUF485 domain-containing protein [Tsukamurella pseudospumae]KXO94066.1 hypothetical protein AXK61_05365 [Tsukamurella pseudospumae]KXP06886.1 hypothetical protein AXK60_12285 [Tsukamurella pseudospumae]